MLKRILLASLAVAALALDAPAALADTPYADCNMTAIHEKDATGDFYEGSAWGYVAHSDFSWGDVSVRCYVTVNGYEASSTFPGTGSGTGMATTTGRVTFAAGRNDVVRLWVEYTTVHGTFAEESQGTHRDIPSSFESSPPDGVPSAACDTGQQIHDGTIAGVYVKLYVRQVAADRLHVCFRVDRDGGRVEITPTMPGVSPSGVVAPSRDSDAGACATTSPPNQMPGPHPLAGGSVLGVPYVFDTYLNGAMAWVCLKFGASVTERLVVPISVPTVGVDPGTHVWYYPDPV